MSLNSSVETRRAQRTRSGTEENRACEGLTCRVKGLGAKRSGFLLCALRVPRVSTASSRKYPGWAIGPGAESGHDAVEFVAHERGHVERRVMPVEAGLRVIGYLFEGIGAITAAQEVTEGMGQPDDTATRSRDGANL